MASYIRVTNPHNHLFWERQLSDQELQQARLIAAQSYQPIRIIPAAFWVVRTNTWENFAKDLLLPTVINHAMKVQDVVLRVLAVLAGLCLDLVILPVRFVTGLISLIANPQKEDHAFYRYLQNNQADPRICESDSVRVRFGWGQHWFESHVNFIPVPTYENAEAEASCAEPPVRRQALGVI